MSSLSPSQRRYLQSRAHALNPVIRLGNKGVTQTVIKELDHALQHHELIKVKLSGRDKTERTIQIKLLVDATQAENIKQIGHIVVLFRSNENEPKIALPH